MGRGVTVKKKQHGVSRVFMNAILKTRLHVDFGKQVKLRFENLRFHEHWARKRNLDALQSRGRNFPYSFPSKTAKSTSILKLANQASRTLVLLKLSGFNKGVNDISTLNADFRLLGFRTR